MLKNDRKALDAFSFSLAGLTTVSPFVVAPAVANDAINRIRDEHIRRARAARDPAPRGWPEGRPQAAQEGAQARA